MVAEFFLLLLDSLQPLSTARASFTVKKKRQLCAAAPLPLQLPMASMENALRDDIAALRKALYQRDREIAILKKQVSHLQQLQAPTSACQRLCGCMASVLRTLCPCWCQPTFAQQLLAEHRMHEQQMNAAPSTMVHDDDAAMLHGLRTASEHEEASLRGRSHYTSSVAST